MKSILYTATCTCFIAIAPALFCTPLEDDWEWVPPLGAHRTLCGSEDSLRDAPSRQQEGEPTKKTSQDGWGWSDWLFLSMKKSHNTPAKKTEKAKDTYGDTTVTHALSALLDEALGNPQKTVSQENGGSPREPVQDNPTHMVLSVLPGVVLSQGSAGSTINLPEGDSPFLGAKPMPQITNPVEPCAPSRVAIPLAEGPQPPAVASQTAPRKQLSPDVQRSLDRMIQANADLLKTIEECRKSRESFKVKSLQ
ncbi:MAG: hypothetical protein ACK5PQ_02445 [Alphaproteobacteria bacterium]